SHFAGIALIRAIPAKCERLGSATSPQPSVRNGVGKSIGKSDIGFLINGFAKPEFSPHFSLREQSRSGARLPG
ncbi:hypothetical protein, partial [Mesorhizobium sp.]|uniref:hypothetical protein n=1 Tax=Mesorhizobium sp. TaxID=1871066 RepID=UPI0025C2BF78